jgi:uncharacterized protein YjbJ (UPF0337 family)
MKLFWFFLVAGAAATVYYWMRGVSGDEVKWQGKFDRAKGKVKETFGRASGDDVEEYEGTFDRAKGEARERVGDFMDPAERAAS